METPLTIRSILVASDLSAASETALKGAAQLAARLGAELHAFHAYEDPGFGSEGREVLVTQRDARNALLAQVERALPDRAPLTSTSVSPGPAAPALIERARQVAADLIVLGPHRRRAFGDRLLGGTAERVLHQSRIPCLVLPQPLPDRCARILVPSDLSEPARAALDLALLWATAPGIAGEEGPSEVRLVHVLDPRGVKLSPGDGELEVYEALRERIEEARRRGLPAESTSADVLAAPSPPDALLRYAGEMEADLLVMGTHGDGVLVRALLGSISAAVVRQAALPVLLVPPPLLAVEEGPAAGGADVHLAPPVA